MLNLSLSVVCWVWWGRLCCYECEEKREVWMRRPNWRHRCSCSENTLTSWCCLGWIMPAETSVLIRLMHPDHDCRYLSTCFCRSTSPPGQTVKFCTYWEHGKRGP